MDDLSAWTALAVAGLATYAWRALGVALAGRIDPNGAVFQWVGAIAYGLLAGLIARMIVLPIGPLQHTDVANRLAAAGLALLVYFLARRSIFLSVAAGTVALVALTAGDVHLL